MLCFALAAFIIPVGAYLALGSPKYVVGQRQPLRHEQRAGGFSFYRTT